MSTAPQFPNETLVEIFEHAAKADLVALCVTSRLIGGLATRLLYRTIDLRSLAQLAALVDAMAPAECALCRHVRMFRLGPRVPRSQQVGNWLAALLPRFHLLAALRLHHHAPDFDESLWFGNLRLFGGIAGPTNSTSLPSFLNRHLTLRCLTLRKGLVGQPPWDSAVLHLPNLHEYIGDSSFLPSLDEASVHGVRILEVSTAGGETDWEAALARFGPLDYVGAESVRDIAATCAIVASICPRVKEVALSSRLRVAELRDVADALKGYRALRTLSCDVSSTCVGTADDLATVQTLAAACPTLRCVVGHDRVWVRRAMGWEMFDKDWSRK
ncbi:hypothetical protein MSAN_02289600 [Mycena sanguinolenta]|uniref:F-box domain-containing protein n=1 Tax=Mycena sanguinolenta TaxID=230812 RepID=A0A8H6WRB3_9AGAR|nr:hypothetical protein MSAN_02529100 [Mycena sanguinolenta]KAF7336574.1 hypothetical protein MSAN_02289600 [Mycena sanguinolenta]